MRPLTPQALGSHTVLVALHPEGMEAVLGLEGAECLLLTNNNQILASISCSYHLANSIGDPLLVVVVGTGRGADAWHQEPAQRAIAVGGEKAEDTLASPAQGTTGAAAEGPPPARRAEVQGHERARPRAAVDLETHVEASRARIMPAASDRLPAAADKEGEGEGPELGRCMEGTGEEDDGLEITGACDAREVKGGEAGVVDREISPN